MMKNITQNFLLFGLLCVGNVIFAGEEYIDYVVIQNFNPNNQVLHWQKGKYAIALIDTTDSDMMIKSLQTIADYLFVESEKPILFCPCDSYDGMEHKKWSSVYHYKSGQRAENQGTHYAGTDYTAYRDADYPPTKGDLRGDQRSSLVLYLLHQTALQKVARDKHKKELSEMLYTKRSMAPVIICVARNLISEDDYAAITQAMMSRFCEQNLKMF